MLIMFISGSIRLLLERNRGILRRLASVPMARLAALGGCWWPIEITPPWAQKLAILLPTG